jgi:hypothetical protein
MMGTAAMAVPNSAVANIFAIDVIKPPGVVELPLRPILVRLAAIQFLFLPLET